MVGRYSSYARKGKRPMKEEIRHIPISKIMIGERFRRDMGDVQELAQSLKEGLLQPIGVTPKMQLVFGERRLLAAKAIGWTTIPARIVDLPSVLMGQIAENTMRKAFTVSERVAIFQAIKTEIGSRQGQRTDRQLRANWPEVKPGQRTDDVAAKHAGLGSRKAAERAQRVVETGVPELVVAMDQEEVSVSAAAKVATLTPEEQKSFLTSHDRITAQQVRNVQAAADTDNDAEGCPQVNGKARRSKFVFNGGTPSSPRQNTIVTPPGICQFLHDLILLRYTAVV